MQAKSLVPSLAILAGLIPTLESGGNILSTGGDFTANGPINAVAYLQTGSCGVNGENCTTVNISLGNTNASDTGSGSSVAIDLDPPHAFSAPTRFEYYSGCDGAGEDCTNPDCQVLRVGAPPPIVCQTDNANIVITFCD
ncbi:hypothetical protein V8D89_002291 [Ganoderma adspersum]